MISSTYYVRMLSACLLLAAALPACQNFRFPEPAPKSTETTQSPDSEPTTHWTKLAREGRNAHRAGDLEASKDAYLAAYEATSHYPADDIRVTTSLDNLARVATAFQKNGEYEQAAPLVETLTQAAEQGRLAEFESGAPPLMQQASHLSRESQEKKNDTTILFYGTALKLLGANDSANSTLRMVAQVNLVSAYIADNRIADAKKLIGPLREEANQKYGEDSAVSVELWISLAQIRVANGDFAGAEAAYKSAIDSSSALENQKIKALELYGELLRNTDRPSEANAITQRLDAMRNPEASEKSAGDRSVTQAPASSGRAPVTPEPDHPAQAASP